jgi:hypothetical protein
MWTRSVPFTASYIARASSPVRARGFSQRMCLPARAAAIAISACRSLGVAMSTMSMSGSSTTRRQSLVALSKPNRAAASAAISSVASARTLRTGIAGAGQKNIGMAA